MKIYKSPPLPSQLILPTYDAFLALQKLTRVFYKCLQNKKKVEKEYLMPKQEIQQRNNLRFRECLYLQ